MIFNLKSSRLFFEVRSFFQLSLKRISLLPDFGEHNMYIYKEYKIYFVHINIAKKVSWWGYHSTPRNQTVTPIHIKRDYLYWGGWYTIWHSDCDSWWVHVGSVWFCMHKSVLAEFITLSEVVASCEPSEHRMKTDDWLGCMWSFL